MCFAWRVFQFKCLHTMHSAQRMTDTLISGLKASLLFFFNKKTKKKTLTTDICLPNLRGAD